MFLNTDFSQILNKIYDTSKHSKHTDIFPKNIFMIIAGSTGCGKTNFTLNLLLNGVLMYDDVMIYTTTPFQDAYKYLRDINVDGDIVRFYNPNETSILGPEVLDKDKTHIVIFDDVMNEDQKVMTDYFCRGRHNNVNAFYLCQSLHQLKKHGIRQNANIFILFHQDKKTVKYFYETHISGDMGLEEFEKLCDKAWFKKHGYIVINIWEPPECGRYLLNYDTLYLPTKYLKIHRNK